MGDGVVIFDAETASGVILGDTSAEVYTSHPSTFLRCIAWALDDGPVQIWKPGEPPPKAFFTASRFCGHNISFERGLWRYKLEPLHGWPPLPPLDYWVDTMILALVLALPGELAKLCKVLNLPYQKASGEIMRQMAKPRLPRPGEDPTIFHFDDSIEHLSELCDYCEMDVLCERSLYLWLLRHLANSSNLSSNDISAAMKRASTQTAC
jgi:hypothetical protein